MPSTPTMGMELITDLRPIDIHLKGLAINSYRRMLKNGYWRPQPGELLSPKNHSNIVTKLTRTIPLIKSETDKLTNTDRSERLFTSEIKQREVLNSQIMDPVPQDEDTINVFTDGSKADNKVGAGYLARSTRGLTPGYNRLQDENSVFQAEITAIKMAADKLLDRQTTDKKIEFHIDSLGQI